MAASLMSVSDSLNSASDWLMSRWPSSMASDDEIHPGGIGYRTRRGDDLDCLTVLQLRAQRRQTPIDLGGDAAVADIRVHRVGEVDHRGAARQSQDLALRREDVDLVREKIDPHALEELLRGAALLHRDEVREPLAGLRVAEGGGEVAGLVLPVCGDARFGDTVHVARTDLRFDRQSVGSEQRRVQRLIAVDARDGNVIFESTRHRPEQAVYHAECAIAVIHRIDDHAQSVDVDDFGQRRALAQHLAVDAVEVLFAGVDLGRDLRLGERSRDALRNASKEFFLVAAGPLQRAFDDAVALRIECTEAEILELEFHGVEAEALGERRVDVERFAGDGATAYRRHAFDRAHVVQPIGELDEDDAQIAHHREQHLAERFGLRFLAALELDLVELGYRIDDLSDAVTETRGDLVLRDGRIFDDVVQDRGDDGVGVDAQIGKDLSRCHRVGDVGLTRFALLAAVGLGAEFGGKADSIDLFGGQVRACGAQQFLEPRRLAGSARQKAKQRLRIVQANSAPQGLWVSLRGRTAARGSPDPAP